MMAKTNWFRESSKDEEPTEPGRDNAGGEQTGHYSSTPCPVAASKSRSSKLGNKEQDRLRTTSVLFVEFSKGGGLQKAMRESLDKLTPMLGFRVRVSEKGGTPLASILSNKDLWCGQPCGRVSCRTCAQQDERKEPCTRRNIIYESECVQCNPSGTRKESDKSSLEDKREQPSLYVGESARSISERATEHWRDAEKGKDESHMQDHQLHSHAGEQPPNFAFRVVKKCKSSLERQVREAVRIQMRGNVLNKQGVYNRCKLTRLVVDEEWEQKVWKEAWAPRVVDVDEEGIRSVSGKQKRKEDIKKVGKRRKMDSEEGKTWGESLPEVEKSRKNFLYSSQRHSQGAGTPVQAKLNPMTGVTWMSRQIIEELVKMASEVAAATSDASTWEEWEEVEEQQPRRSRKEEEWLWKRLEESDKQRAKMDKYEAMKRAKKIDRARARMKVGKEQPSIKHCMPSAMPKYRQVEPVKPAMLLPAMQASKPERQPEFFKPVGGGDGCVNTQTGSLSNNVCEASQVRVNLEPVETTSQVPGTSRLPVLSGRMSESLNKKKNNECIKNVTTEMSLQKQTMPEKNMSVAQLSVWFGPSEVQSKPSVSDLSKAKMTYSTPVHINNGGPQVRGGGGIVEKVIKFGGGKQKKRGVFPSADANVQINVKENDVKNRHNIQRGKISESFSNLTPIKRKLQVENNTSSLVNIFETKTSTNPQRGCVSESPAKRRRCGNGVSEPT